MFSNLFKKIKLPHFLSFTLFLLFLALVIHYQFILLDFKEWGDESETIVVAKLIASGKSLYSEIHMSHGPLIYLPGIALEKLGDYGVHSHRIFILLLQLSALTSLYYSPLLITKSAKRIYTGLAASFMVLLLPKFFGHAYIFQTMAGLFLIIILAQFTLPSVCCEDRIRPFNVIVGSVLLASLPFIGISYAPISILLSVASVRKENISLFTKSITGSLLLNIIYLSLIGSLIGFYVFHIYYNATIMPAFSKHFYPTTFSESILNILESATKNLSGIISLIVFTVITINIITKEKIFFWRSILNWRSILIMIAMSSLLLRGADIHGSAYYFAWMSIPLTLFKNRKSWNIYILWVALLILLLCCVKLSLLIKSDRDKLASKEIQLSTEFSNLVRIVTSENDKIIAYSNQNYEYIASHRLPASGSFYYLPWVEKYNQNPQFKIVINACNDIESYKPKIMLVDKWYVWDEFPWPSYGECIQKILDKDYVKLKNKPYYLRKDIYIEFIKN